MGGDEGMGAGRGRFDYPEAPRGDWADTYHGMRVPDPYRALEDADAPATRAWIAAENRLTEAFLASIPARERIRERLTRLWNYARYGVPFRHGDSYFFFKNDGLQNQAVLYAVDAADGLDAEPRPVLDPNGFSPDGTVALSGLAVSEDGRRLAYGMSKSGSDWQEWRVRDLATGADLADRLEWIKFSGAAWTHDGAGFFYGRYPEPGPGDDPDAPNYDQKLYYHRLGTPQAEDELVYHRPGEREWGYQAEVDEGGRYLWVTVWKGTDTRNLAFWKDLARPGEPVAELVGDFRAAYHFIGMRGRRAWFRTDRDAPRGKVAAVDLDRPDHWEDVVPESAATLEGVSLVAGRLVALYLEDACSRVRQFGLDGEPLGEIPLPGLGTAEGFGGRSGDRETFYAFTSYTAPATIYRHDFAAGAGAAFRAPAVAFDPAEYLTERHFCTSRDGTRIPIFVSRRRDLPRDGDRPAYLYGYGGFAISLTPAFSVANLAWMEMGGVLAVACLRGGGEYGEDWHQAGAKAGKQRVFDDFIAAAEWLVANGYTRPARLAIAGGSNGGLLVGACLVQRPDLFGAALPAVGVLDMLRFHKFTIGWAWIPEYGSADNPEDFPVLLAYSPLHNLEPGAAYPATLITTADHDDRVLPAHSFKFAAALQAAQGGDAPVLIRVEEKAGHGAGKPTAKLIAEAADRLAFLVRALGMEGGGA